MSQEYDTASFVADTIHDLPDYPGEWNDHYYGWGGYSWGTPDWDGSSYEGVWYPHSNHWDGWWIGERHLSTDELAFTVRKLKYKLTANPTAPVTIRWSEVFVPDDDPSTPGVDERKNIKIIAERTWNWGPGQNECLEYEIDPSARQDGNGYYTLLVQPVHLSTPELGEAGRNVSGQETDPGKVVLVNDGDADQDTIPDYGDGYGLHGDNDYEAESADVHFTPLHVDWVVVDPAHAKVRFTYEASDPLALTHSGWDWHVLPNTGKLRLWTKDGSERRDGHDVKQGGHFVRPGVDYTLQDLGVNPGDYQNGGKTFYVEAVKPSAGVADLPVRVEFDPTGTLGYVWSDQLRFTATKIELVDEAYDETEFTTANGLVLSRLDDFDHTTQIYGFTPGSYALSRIRLHDPRATVIREAKVGQNRIPVTPSGDYLSTGNLIFVRPGLPVQDSQLSQLPATVVRQVPGDGVLIEYNPFEFAGFTIGTSKTMEPAQDVENVVDKVAESLRDEGWSPADPTDKGAFGKAVHLAVTDHFKGKADWVTNVYVADNGNILSVGRELPLNEIPAGSTQIDLLKVRNEYHVTAGPNQYLRKDKILYVGDVKTTDYLRLNSRFKNQISRITTLTGHRDLHLPKPKIRWSFEIARIK